MEQTQAATPYRPMTLVELAGYLAGAESDSLRWRYVLEFLNEYRWEPIAARLNLLVDEPPSTGDERWDVLLAAVAEHLATRDGHGAPAWSASRSLGRDWFPWDIPALRADAVINALPAFRRRGVFVTGHDIEIA